MRFSKERIILFFIIFLGPIFLIYSQNQQSGFESSPRDPLLPLIAKNGSILIPSDTDISGLNLKGIIYSEGNSIAIINDEVLSEGDKIGNYFVLKIDERNVLLKKDNETFTLKLEGE